MAIFEDKGKKNSPNKKLFLTENICKLMVDSKGSAKFRDKNGKGILVFKSFEENLSLPLVSLDSTFLLALETSNKYVILWNKKRNTSECYALIFAEQASETKYLSPVMRQSSFMISLSKCFKY